MTSEQYPIPRDVIDNLSDCQKILIAFKVCTETNAYKYKKECDVLIKDNSWLSLYTDCIIRESLSEIKK